MNAHEPHVPDPNPEGQDEPASPQQSVPIDPASLAAHYELEDINYRAILWFGGAVLAGVVVVNLILYWLVGSLSDQPIELRVQIPPALVTPAPVPGPGLDAAPEVRLNETLQIEAQRLGDYAWLDKEAGVVRIPIDQAMSLLVEQGLPAREAEAPDFGLRPAYRMDSSGGLRPVGGELEVAGAGPNTEGAAETESGSTGEEGTGEGDSADGTAGGEASEDEVITDDATNTESAGEGDQGSEGEVTNENVPEGESTNNTIQEGEGGEGGTGNESGADNE